MILTIIILSLVLTLSLSANVVLLWYNRQAVEKLVFISDNIGDIMGLVQEYHEHLESLYEMEMFYGDETLQHLIEHTRSLYDLLEDFEDVYSIAIPPEEDSEETEQITNEETEIDAQTTINQENVFYGGTRKSNN